MSQGDTSGSGQKGTQGREAAPPKELTFEPVPIEVGVLCASIDDVDKALEACVQEGVSQQPYRPVDALAVGHYVGTTRLSGPERALDVKLSLVLGGVPPGGRLRGRDRVITGYARRDLISGDLGRVFFLPDPVPAPIGRVIALAGMGRPGRFGVAELTFMARELCWALGRMGKKHLATVVIGAGVGNIGADEAIRAWMRGVRAALTELEQKPLWQLKRITFVETDPQRAEGVRNTLLDFAKREMQTGRENRPRLEIVYVPLRPAETRNVTTRVEAPRDNPDDQNQKPTPARLLIERDGKRLRFGALTQTASVPERQLGIDPSLVEEANTRLARFNNAEDQEEWARYMGYLVFPAELAELLTSQEPLVLMVDSSTARIQWEMLVPPPPRTEGTLPREPLGLVRGISRQLRTVFAPPPEPAPPPRRLLRVLIVADPADDLPSALKEAEVLAALFEAFNTVHRLDNYRVEVKVLAGSRHAGRNDVLFQLIACGPYDILHYAGHCSFSADDPLAAGWVFANGVLSVHELNRIDHIPRFVFANACESGVTPDRADEGDLGLAPSFAESFFARGVANFVCTAWRVDDNAARDFAVALYAGMLGLKGSEGGNGYEAADKPLAMYEAMLQARKRVYGEADHAPSAATGVRTWGAYQHYGDPFLLLFDPEHFGGKTSVESISAPVSSIGPSTVHTAGRPGPAAAVPSAEKRALLQISPELFQQPVPEGGKTMSSG